MQEPLLLSEVYEVCRFSLVTDSNLYVVLLLEWALLDNVFKFLSHSYCIAPVQTQVIKGFIGADDHPTVVLYVLVEAMLIQFHSDSSILFKLYVDLTLLLQANVHPRASSLLHRPPDYHAFSVRTPLCNLQVMLSFHGISKA